jgi:hypothetical protein
LTDTVSATEPMRSMPGMHGCSWRGRGGGQGSDAEGNCSRATEPRSEML